MEEKQLVEEEMIDNVSPNLNNIFIILQLYPYIAPENFENSKISSITNEQLFIKLSDLLEQKEISKYITTKEKLISIIEKYCEFFQFSEDKERIQYVLPEGMTVFSILNIPPKLNKEEVKHHLELVNLQYNRLYKKGFYWYLSTIDKETVICVQNSLRELIFDEIRIKYIHNNKNQILKYMKDKMDKNSYQKDAKYLGINNKGYSKYNYTKGKMSDSDSGSFSWRKGSGGSKSSFDYAEKPYKKGKNYKYKRNRFNSDNDGKKYNKYNNNYYKNYGSNNSNISNNSNNSNQEVEIDISKLKYSLNIKNKYSFGDIKAFYEKNKNNILEKPKFLNEELVDIIGNNKKEIVSLNELIESSEKNKKVESPSDKKEDEKNTNGNNNVNTNININTNIKIPKMNPLSGMSKNFNKFDIVPGNAMPGLMMPFQTSPWIEESNEEQ